MDDGQQRVSLTQRQKQDEASVQAESPRRGAEDVLRPQPPVPVARRSTAPGERSTVELALDRRAFAYWSSRCS